MYAWIALAGVVAFGLFLGPLNSTCCLVGPQAEYASIQAALDAAAPGSTVVVLPGVYRENIVIDKPVRLLNVQRTLLGALSNGNQYLIQAADDARPAVEVRAPNVTFQGFIVRGGSAGVRVSSTRNVQIVGNRVLQSAGAGIEVAFSERVGVVSNWVSSHPGVGIHLQDSRHVRVLDNELQRNATGVRLSATYRALLKANTFKQQTQRAVSLDRSPDNALVANRFSGNAGGVLLRDSPNTALRANALEAGPQGLWVEGDGTSDYVQDIDTSNTVGERPVIYLVGLRDRKLKENLEPGYLALVNARDVEIQGLTVSNRPHGLLLVGSRGITVEGATLDGNGTGILALDSHGLTFKDTVVLNSAGDGLRFERSEGLALDHVTVNASGGHGLYVSGGSALTLSDSRLVANGGSGARLIGVRNGELRGNVLTQNGLQAVLLQESEGIGVRDNVLSQNPIGVSLERARGNAVERNAIRENEWGVFLQASSDNTIVDNTFADNARGDVRGYLENNRIQPTDD